MAEYPEYTNEQLLAMPTDQLINLATDFGFDPNRYGKPSIDELINKYGEAKVRQWLKAFIYCSPHNHPIRCYAKTMKTGILIDLAKQLWICLQLAGLSYQKYNISHYIKPDYNILESPEII